MNIFYPFRDAIYAHCPLPMPMQTDPTISKAQSNEKKCIGQNAATTQRRTSILPYWICFGCNLHTNAHTYTKESRAKRQRTKPNAHFFPFDFRSIFFCFSLSSSNNVQIMRAHRKESVSHCMIVCDL